MLILYICIHSTENDELNDHLHKIVDICNNPHSLKGLFTPVLIIKLFLSNLFYVLRASGSYLNNDNDFIQK